MHSQPVSSGLLNSSFLRLGLSVKIRFSFVALIFITALTLSAAAQAVKTASTPPPELSRFDLYGGYGYLHPIDSDIFNVKYQAINPGAVVSAAAYFNRYLGVQAEGSFFPSGPNDCVFTAQAGPIFRYQKNRFVPFAHVLGGGAKVGGPIFQPCTWGWGITSGLGFDYILPAFNNRIAIRPIQADFHYSHVDYGPADVAMVSGGTGEIYAYRLSAGFVLRLGQLAPPPPVQLGCTVQPANVFPGDPITVTATAANLDLKKKATYTWTTSGGQITGNDATATVSTAGLAPGDYTVSGHVSEGVRPGQQASCTAGFRVHAYEPPTIACSANPSTVMPGDPSTVTSIASSPQNRTLTYSYSATAGQIASSTSTATLVTTGVLPSTITVTCNVVDDLGKQATANTTVTITAPPPPVAPPVRNLCSVSFERDKKRPLRVDNEAKGCLDEVALTLNRDTTSKLVIVGHHSSDETPDAAAQRDLNVQQYLVDEKGIDPTRIEMRTGGELNRSLDNVLVPAGATFIPGDTNTFDTNSVKRRGQPYGTPKTPTKTHPPAN
jgi:outer membrane protein OmpA-like peptidoglycan-associated protein